MERNGVERKQDGEPPRAVPDIYEKGCNKCSNFVFSFL